VTASALLGGVLAGASVLALGTSRSARARSRLLALPAPAPATRSPAPTRPPYTVGLLVGLVGALALGVDGLDPVALIALFAAGASVLWLSRQRSAAVARRRAEAIAAELPSAADLLATCLISGATPADALQTVADATHGPLADRLRQVAGALRLGAEHADAWGPVTRADPVAPLARAFIRSDATGAPIAETVMAVADDQRRVARWTAEAAARRAGVLAVGPLALCFLPAFILTGVVPVIVSVASDVLDGLR
jgi:pilus assembly protein TadC